MSGEFRRKRTQNECDVSLFKGVFGLEEKLNREK